MLPSAFCDAADPECIAPINRVVGLFCAAFDGLGVAVSLEQVERLATQVHHSMGQGRRVYHTCDHLFDMARGMNPRQVLAVLFHDLVYVQLDGGFPRMTKTLLDPVVMAQGDQLRLRPHRADDPCSALCAEVFGFVPGQVLPLFGGLNEFLSAVVATHLLQAHVPLHHLVAIVGCIEATVPFRGPGAQGEPVYERLMSRLVALNHTRALGLHEDDLARMVQDAVLMANQDVVNFSAADPGQFLSTTWQLIEESNAPLAAVGVYGIVDYRQALVRMEGFLSSLNPDHVFHCFRGTPGAVDFAALQAAARANLAFSLDYLAAKIATIALIEALAIESGGDCPVSMLLGHLHRRHGTSHRVEDHLPALAQEAPTEPGLLAVLEKGRAKEAARDLTDSPLAAYLYRCEGHDGMRRAMQRARQMFAGELSAGAFLDGFQPHLVASIAAGCAMICATRAQRLRELAQAYGAKA